MSRDRANFFSYLFIVAAVGVAAFLYPSLPDAVPSHWNVRGEVDGYLSKPWGVIFLGIRTPWTLASDEVWGRTHRLAGRLFILLGLIMFAGVLFEIPVAVLLGMVGVIVVVPVVYSYVIYRRVEGFGEGDGSLR
jgi:uncharacterized membrane protein